MSDCKYFINKSTGCYDSEIDVDLAEECIEEVNNLKCNKVKFLNTKIEDRLNKCNNVFLEDFNSGIDEIISMIDNDMYANKEYMKLMKKVSKATSTSQSSFFIILKELSKLNKEVESNG